MARKKQRFVRTDFRKYSKLGVRRKKKQIYRKSKGRDNKMRLKMKGHLRNVNIGFGNEKKNRGLINNLKPVWINNLKELKKITKNEIGIITKIGSKKRKEILDYALKNNVRLVIEPKKELEKIEQKLKKAKEEKMKRIARKIKRDEKARKEAEKKAKQEAKEEKNAAKEKTDNSETEKTNIEENKEEIK